jgi:tetratricopeptide (TPR) repeat protein
LGFDRGGSKTLRMELACRACGDTNFYEVGQVFLSPEAPKSPPYIGGEHACLSCGALDSLEAGGDAMLALTAELFRIKIASEREQEFESPLKLVTSKLADGQLLSVGAAIEWYKKAVAKNPGSLVNTLSLGNCYESVGRRRQAEECFRRCLTIDPACPEAAYALAEILSENDHPGEAFLVLDNAVKHQDQWRFYRLTTITPQEFTVALLEFHEELDPAPRRLSLDPPRSYFAAAGEEPGYRGKTPPNAPCPCGSGRKYKKCCGRMA